MMLSGTGSDSGDASRVRVLLSGTGSDFGYAGSLRVILLGTGNDFGDDADALGHRE